MGRSAHCFASYGDRGPNPAEEPDDHIALELKQVYERLNQDGDYAGGFTVLAVVVFDDGTDLQRVLATPDSAERQMALVEIVSVLSLATACRVTEHDTLPVAARISLAEHLRIRLTKMLPVPLSLWSRTDGVHDGRERVPALPCVGAQGR